jgi:hypothetical protein
MPIDVGDVYLLVDYLYAGHLALAFVGTIDDPTTPNSWLWAMYVDDGDVYECRSVEEFYDSCPVSAVYLIRRAREGLAPYIEERVPRELVDRMKTLV